MYLLLQLGLMGIFAGIPETPVPRTELAIPVTSIPVDGRPEKLHVAQGRLFVSSFQGANISVFDLRTRELIKKIELDAYEVYVPLKVKGKVIGKTREVRLYPPGEMVVANGKVFVGQVFSDQLVVLDLKTLRPIKRLPLGGEGVFAATSDGKTIYYASNQKSEFYSIDTEGYDYLTEPYPGGGRGIGSIALDPKEQRIYLGIQRGGAHPDGLERGGGNSFLAIFDLAKRKFEGTIYLATLPGPGWSDDSIPKKLLFSSDGRRLHIGMFQSLPGIRVVDTETRKILHDIPFAPNARNKHFPWVDPMSLEFAGDWLLSVNRHNREVAVMDQATNKPVARLSFVNGKHEPTCILAYDEFLYLCDPGCDCVHIISAADLRKCLAPLGKMGETKIAEIILALK